MKKYTVILLTLTLTGCQSDLPTLSESQISALSNEALCRSLGTYNHDGCLVLKIYDELNRRPQKIDPERCYVLEKMGYEQSHSEVNPVKSFSTDMTPNPAMPRGVPGGILPPEAAKRIQRDREKYRIKNGF